MERAKRSKKDGDRDKHQERDKSRERRDRMAVDERDRTQTGREATKLKESPKG